MSSLVISVAVAAATQQALQCALSVCDGSGRALERLEPRQDVVEAFIASALFEAEHRPYFIPLAVRNIWPTSVSGVFHLMLGTADLAMLPDVGESILVVRVRVGDREGQTVTHCSVR